MLVQVDMVRHLSGAAHAYIVLPSDLAFSSHFALLRVERTAGLQKFLAKQTFSVNATVVVVVVVAFGHITPSFGFTPGSA